MDNKSTSGVQRWNSFDTVKGIACIAVTLIHYNFASKFTPEIVSTSVKAVCRIGVPIFFFISGYFLSPNGQYPEPKKTVKKIRHIIQVLFVSAVFYSIFDVFINIMRNDDWNRAEYVKSLFVPAKVIKLLITNDPFVYSHLWFMMALIFVYIFVLIILNEKTFKAVYIAPVLLTAYTLMQEFEILPASIPIIGTDGKLYIFNLFIFRALPFVMFGVIAKRNEERIAGCRLNAVSLICLIAIGAVMSVAEAQLFNVSQFYIGNYVMVFALVVICIKYPGLKIPFLYHIGKDLSMYIYILHIAVGKLYDLFAVQIFGVVPAVYYVKPVVILAVVILLSECVFRVKEFFCRRGLKKSRKA